VNFEQYSDLAGCNWSLLREMAKSPAHYAHRLHNPRSDTPAMRFGRAVHTCVLEPDLFPVHWTLYDGRRAGNAWQEFAAVNSDKGILTVDEYETVLAIRDSVQRHKLAARLLRRGKSEVTLRWVDPATRIRCKARLDHLCGDALTDLKTTKDVDNRVFGRLAERMAYHGQLGFYRRGLLATGHKPAPVHILAVEAEAPHDVAVFAVDEDVLEAGDMLVAKLLHQVKTCRRLRRWPGRYESEESLEFPAWALPAGSDYTTAIEVL
jgi:hypothetical protein